MEGDRIKVPWDTSPKSFVTLLSKDSTDQGAVPQPHDDGEKDLGPTVACLALGSPAKMYFRPKKGKEFAKVKKGAVEYTHVLDFPVHHGDLVIMHGTPIHEFYEVRQRALFPLL
jgi:alkylated DNA repair dioxygenase AlkB